MATALVAIRKTRPIGTKTSPHKKGVTWRKRAHARRTVNTIPRTMNNTEAATTSFPLDSLRYWRDKLADEDVDTIMKLKSK